MPVPLHIKNTSLRNLPHEEWKLLPGFGDNYMLSNYGRIKSLPRIVERPTQGSYTTKERILARRIGRQKIQGTKRTIKLVWGQITYGKRSRPIPIARYTCYLFVEPFDLSDRHLVIMTHDGNPLNTFYTNLFVSTKKKLMERTYRNGRNTKAFGNKPKKVIQYDLNGTRIQVYNSLNEAERLTGIDCGAISEVARGKRRQHRGFVWKYDK